jgi:hypothetical protein
MRRFRRKHADDHATNRAFAALMATAIEQVLHRLVLDAVRISGASYAPTLQVVE